MPSALVELGSDTNWELGGGGGKMGIETLLVLAALFVGVVAGVVFMTQGQRRIPTQRPSTCAAGGSTAARGSTCRCGSTRRA